MDMVELFNPREPGGSEWRAKTPEIAIKLVAVALACHAVRAICPEPELRALEPAVQERSAALVGKYTSAQISDALFRVPARGREAGDGGRGGQGVGRALGGGWQGDLREGGTVGKGFVANGGEALCEADSSEGGAARKGSVGHRFQAGRQGDGCEGGAEVEGSVAEGGETGGNGDGGERGAVVKGLMADRQKASGEAERRKGGAEAEGIVADGDEAVWEGDGDEAGAVKEGPWPDGDESAGAGDRDERAAAESTSWQMRDALWQCGVTRHNEVVPGPPLGHQAGGEGGALRLWCALRGDEDHQAHHPLALGRLDIEGDHREQCGGDWAMLRTDPLESPPSG